MGILAPGLDGYRAAVDDEQRRDLSQLQTAGGILGIQSQLAEQQMNPLKLEQLRMAIERQKRNNELFTRIATGTPADPRSAPIPSNLQGGGIFGAEQPQAPRGGVLGVPETQGGVFATTTAPRMSLPADVQAALLSGDPGMSAWAKEQAKIYAPTDRMRDANAAGIVPGSPAYNAFLTDQATQGGIWRLNPLTGERTLVPGFAPGMAEIEAAQQGERIGTYTINDRPYQMKGKEYSAYSGPLNTPEQVKAHLDVAQRFQLPQRQFNVSAGSAGDVLPAIMQPQSARTGRIFGGQTEGEKRTEEKIGAEVGDMYATINKAGLNAPGAMSKYQYLGGLLDQVNTGKFMGSVQTIKAAAKSVGIDLNALGVRDDVAPAQAAAALTNQLALELRNPSGGAGMPGAMSDQDREFLKQMIAGIENDPGAITRMIDYRMKVAQRDQDVAKLARDYKRRNGRFDENFFDELATWSEKNPLFSKPSAATQPGGAPPSARQFSIDGGKSVTGTFDPNAGKYYVIQGGRKFWVEE